MRRTIACLYVYCLRDSVQGCFVLRMFPLFSITCMVQRHSALAISGSPSNLGYSAVILKELLRDHHSPVGYNSCLNSRRRAVQFLNASEH